MILPHDEIGTGPAIVLLHAGIVDRRMWSEHLEPLADEGRRVLALDLPGFGDAPAAGSAAGPWGDVIETLDALEVGRCALAGNSFGAAIAQRVALLAPERLTALVLVSAPPEGVAPSPRLLAVWDAEEAALERGDLDGAVEGVLDAWTLPDASAHLREHVAQMQRRALELQAGAPEQELEDPLNENPAALAGLSVPSLISVGEHDMEDFHQAAEVLARWLPDAERATIAAAGHLAPLERPTEFRVLLLDFLERRERREPA
jgi:pimeloyl-ACP methyl ester carboxylesterase